MFVIDRMTRNPISISPDDNVDAAQDLLKKHKIRRLPVVERGKLVGIITEKDLMRVAPSAATTLSKYEINSLLAKISIRDIMSDKVISVNENAPIEEAALLMSMNKIGGLPVVSDVGTVVGIITETDIFNSLVEIMGLSEGKTRITIEVDNKVGVVQDIAGIFAGAGFNIDSFVTCKKDMGKYDIIIRGDFMNVEPLLKKLEEHGYHVIHAGQIGSK
ncbi:MAG: CBS domain-containing protein [Schwartzia sp.]|nr:CBS domain-containing protein [Schwartzia sp. (in: firmicutes)]